jgi:hypothetical protein
MKFQKFSIEHCVNYQRSRAMLFKKLQKSLLKPHSGSNLEIRHGARGLLGVHTFFIVAIFSTKAVMQLDS